MAVDKGRGWGEPADPPPTAVVASSDAEAGHLASETLRSGVTPPEIVLVGGDLFRTLGGRHGRAVSGVRFKVDVGEVRHDGTLAHFVAHAIARRGWWRGRILAAMNAEFVGDWKVAPRAHPGDGLVDLIDANPSVQQRLLARRRLAHGDHLPHPDIATSRASAAEFGFDWPLGLWLDGSRVGECRALSVKILPAALVVYL